MTGGTVHIIGAGLSGLSAAVALAGRGVPVIVYEATSFAGGRCRSYFDSALEQEIDNGNHLILSGNRAVHAFLRATGAADNFLGPAHPEFAFADLRSGERWTLRPNEGALPWWIFSRARRVPGTHAGDYLALRRLLRPDATVAGERGVLWERLLHPFLLAALNTDLAIAAPELIATLMRETLAKGGRFYIPRIAAPTLSAAFIAPALRFLEEKGASVRFGERLREIVFDGGRVAALDIGETRVPLDAGDRVILAVPPWIAAALLPDLTAPDEFRGIVSGHFKIAPPAGTAPITGIIGGTVEWVFAFPDRISVTVSNADRLLDTNRDDLAAAFWRETAPLFGLPETLPPWQIVKERRATFAATPAQEKKRLPAETRWPNLFLAGDWTKTGLPATIEGAVRSGQRAAELALAGALV
jgi:squalene-associated FAD-dependent desaturase